MNIQIFGTKKDFDCKKATVGYQPEIFGVARAPRPQAPRAPRTEVERMGRSNG